MNKTALLTGGSRGIGAATADMLRARGWTVIAPARGELDVTDARSIKNYTFRVGAMLAHGIDALILCAGEWYSKEMVEQPPYEWIDQYELNVVGPWVLMVRLLNLLRGGCVVSVASTRGFIGGVNTAPYSCAKAAQIALMQGYAREYPGVRFNVIAPGLTKTRMAAQVIATGGAKPGAVGQPEEAVAQAIVSLIEDGESNGRVMRVVDGAATEARWTWE